MEQGVIPLPAGRDAIPCARHGRMARLKLDPTAPLVALVAVPHCLFKMGFRHLFK